jgi:uncharacterized protein
MDYQSLRKRCVLFSTIMLAGTVFIFGQTAADSIPVINVNGAGEVMVVPDVLELNIGIRSEADSSAEAMAMTSRKMNELIGTLKEAGIPGRDIRTRNIRLHPTYQTEDGRRQVTGYIAVNTVFVKIRDMEAAGGIIDDAVRAGGNVIEGIQFTIENPAPYAEQAREKAFENARHKAEQLTALAGMELDTVMSLSESSHLPSPVTPRLQTQARTFSEVPVEAGVQKVQVNVQAVWSMKKKGD